MRTIKPYFKGEPFYNAFHKTWPHSIWRVHVPYPKSRAENCRIAANPQCTYGNRKNAWFTPFVSVKYPPTTPQTLMLKGTVACIPSPGASKNESLPLGVRTKP